MDRLQDTEYLKNMGNLYRAAYREKSLRKFANAAPAEIPEWFCKLPEVIISVVTAEQRYFRWRWYYAAAMVVEEEKARAVTAAEQQETP